MALEEALWKEKLYQSVSKSELDTLSYKKEGRLTQILAGAGL